MWSVCVFCPIDLYANILAVRTGADKFCRKILCFDIEHKSIHIVGLLRSGHFKSEECTWITGAQSAKVPKVQQKKKMQ